MALEANSSCRWSKGCFPLAPAFPEVQNNTTRHLSSRFQVLTDPYYASFTTLLASSVRSSGTLSAQSLRKGSLCYLSRCPVYGVLMFPSSLTPAPRSSRSFLTQTPPQSTSFRPPTARPLCVDRDPAVQMQSYPESRKLALVFRFISPLRQVIKRTFGSPKLISAHTLQAHNSALTTPSIRPRSPLVTSTSRCF